MNAETAKKEIAARAGVPSGNVAVFFARYEHKPPTLQRVHGNMRKRRGQPKRRVIVGPRWLQKHAPEVWAAFIAARLLGGDQVRFIPSFHNE